TVVIGYSVGFDLAVLKAEHERHGLPWQPPRSLDVGHLVDLVAPALPEKSLETAAGWLGVELSGRHRALGDALAAAEIYRAVVPKLREKGIVTLAQAERAVRALSTRMTEEAQSGWHDMGQSGDARDGSRIAEYVRIDSFAYRHRVADLMKHPPLTVGNDRPVRAALAAMMERKVSSLFLPPESADGPDGIGDGIGDGIVTERDIMRAIDRDGPAALDAPVGNLGQRPLVTIHKDEFVYRAIARMSAGGFRHLGVVDEGGALCGALSARDLLHQRAGDAVALGDSIESARSRFELGRVWSQLTAVARALVFEEVDARNIASMISRELRALTARACELAEAEMAEAGLGEAPAPYALLVLGSGGRGESLLAMDQDNALIYADDAPDGADGWFEQLGRRTADILDETGVIYCPGGIMASNAAWRKPLGVWRETVRSWIGRSRAEDLLNCDIFFDAQAVLGARAMADSLRAEALELARQAWNFHKFLAISAGNFDTPVGMFGRFRTEAGRVDLKIGGIMPIFSAARVIALMHGVEARTTPKRLAAARGLETVSGKDVDNLVEAHRILLSLILGQQLRDIDAGVALSNKVAPSDLNGFEKQEMKWALAQVPLVSNLLGVPALGR
ncbi:MAG: CBS domain-containing protein, partial [Rhodospirillaceae bacterium]|nr:CBS domain-containing protein [Rhodospirillaceae bacterium]